MSPLISVSGTRRSGNPLQRFALSADDATVSVEQGQSVAIILTLDRGTFAESVALAVSGLPTGVTGAFSDTTLTGAATTSTLTLTASDGATPVVDAAFVITGSGAGAADERLYGTVSVIFPGLFFDNFDNGAKNNSNGVTYTSAASVTVSADRAYSGQYALKFAYPAGTVPESERWAEQRMSLGAHKTALWFDYQLYVPSDYHHQDSASSDNNKFFVLWRDIYSDVANGANQLGFEMLPAAGGTGYSRFRPVIRRYSDGVLVDWGLPTLGAPFIGGAGPIQIGQWNRIRMQFQFSSSAGVADGVCRFWVGDALWFAVTDQVIWNSAASTYGNDVWWRDFYFMGYWNAAPPVDCDMYIDDLKIFDVDPGWTT